MVTPVTHSAQNQMTFRSFPNASSSEGEESHGSLLLQTCFKFLQQNHLTDVSIHVGDVQDVENGIQKFGDPIRTFRCHKLVLSTYSKFFCNEFLKPGTDHLFISNEDISVDNLGRILNFMYTGEVTIDPEHIKGLHDCAQKLDVELLLQDIDRNLDSQLNATRALNLVDIKIEIDEDQESEDLSLPVPPWKAPSLTPRKPCPVPPNVKVAFLEFPRRPPQPPPVGLLPPLSESNRLFQGEAITQHATTSTRTIGRSNLSNQICHPFESKPRGSPQLEVYGAPVTSNNTHGGQCRLQPLTKAPPLPASIDGGSGSASASNQQVESSNRRVQTNGIIWPTTTSIQKIGGGARKHRAFETTVRGNRQLNSYETPASPKNTAGRIQFHLQPLPMAPPLPVSIDGGPGSATVTKQQVDSSNLLPHFRTTKLHDSLQMTAAIQYALENNEPIIKVSRMFSVTYRTLLRRLSKLDYKAIRSKIKIR